MANIKREERVNDDDDVRACLLCHHFESYYIRHHANYLVTVYGFCSMEHRPVKYDKRCEMWRARDIVYPSIKHATEMRLKKLLDELRDIYDEIFGLKR